jgi:hypothetical protein
VTEAKEASKVGEEKRKEKEALRVERKLKISVNMTKKSTTTTRKLLSETVIARSCSGWSNRSWF